jgi:hypothetical protein
MALPIDITTIISYGKISSYLAANDFSRQKLLRGRAFNTKLPQKLDVATNLVEWAYNQNSTDTSLISTGNYLYQLCGRYIAEAQLIIGSGGSGIIINPATGVISTIQQIYLQFTVGVTSSPQSVNGIDVTLPVSGETQIVLPLEGILDRSIFVVKDGTELPIGATDRVSFTPVYTPTSVTITIGPTGTTFQNNDLFVIQGLQYVAL